MSEEYTCIECEELYDDTDGDTEERMCNICLDEIYDESVDAKKKTLVKWAMGEFDELIDLINKGAIK